MTNIFERYDIEDVSKAERLYKKYKNMLYYISLKILKEHYSAEDAVQESFARIIRHLDKIDEKDEIRARGFLSAVCKNISISIYRKRLYLNKSGSADDLNLETTAKMANPENVTIEHECLSSLYNQIRRLPMIYRDILILKYVLEYDNSEISGILDVSLATIRKRLERARTKLKELLKKEF